MKKLRSISCYVILFVITIFSNQTAKSEVANEWKFSCGPIFGRPIISDTIAYFGSFDKNIYAINIKNGKEIWHYKADTINSVGAIKGNTVVFEAKNKLYALNTVNGHLRWTFSNNDSANVSVGFTDYHHSSPVISGNMVVFCDQFGYINGIELDNGKLIYQYQIESKKPIRSTPAIKDNIVYVGDWIGNIYAVSLTKPTLIWKHVMDSVRNYYGAVVSEMIIKDDILFFGSQHDVVSPLDIKTGKPVWKYFQPQHTYLPSTPVFRGDKMYIATTIFANKVYCFDYKKGSDAEWQFQAEGIFFTTPIVKDSVLIINSSLNFDKKTSHLYFINCNNGKLLSKTVFTNMCPSFPLLHNEILYLGMNDGLYAFDYKKMLKEDVQ